MPPAGRRPPPSHHCQPQPPLVARLVGEVLGTVRLPEELVEALPGQFLTVWEEGGPLSMERRNGRGIHSFLIHLTSRVEPVPVESSQVQPGRNGTPSAIVFLRPGRPVIHVPVALCLPGRASGRGPPSSG